MIHHSGDKYFSTHYHLGARKFETADDEQFLFGELSDLNLMSACPTAVSGHCVVHVHTCMLILVIFELFSVSI